MFIGVLISVFFVIFLKAQRCSVTVENCADLPKQVCQCKFGKIVYYPNTCIICILHQIYTRIQHKCMRQYRIYTKSAYEFYTDIYASTENSYTFYTDISKDTARTV